MSDWIIELEDLCKSFGDKQVLTDINLKIARGKITVIIGGSGSGKTVLVKHIIGLLRPTSGRILVDGEDIAGMGDVEMARIRMKFGMLFQSAALFDSMNVMDNVAFPLVEHTKLKGREIKAMVKEKLEMLGLFNVEHLFPSELSGGMRKRVGLARAVILNPDIVIYDEPTTGLDPISTQNVDEMILEAQEKFNITSVVISHDMASTFRIADHMAMIYQGTILVQGPPEEFIKTDDPRVLEFTTTSGVTLEKMLRRHTEGDAVEKR